MKLNNKPAMSGTLIISPGQTGELSFPWGDFELVFNPTATPMNVGVTLNPQQIVFDGTDNVIGVATSISLPMNSGANVDLNLVVYAIGDVAVTRIVHYSFA